MINKNIKLLFNIIFILTFSFLVSSCDENVTEQITLDSPVIEIVSDNLISWQKIENADSYRIYINEELSQTTVELSISLQTLNKHEDYFIKIKAYDSKGNYLESPFSNTIVLNKQLNNKLSTPTVTINGNKLIISEIINADSYEIYENGFLIDSITSTIYEIDKFDEASYSYTVRAISLNGLFENSSYSNSVIYTNHSSLKNHASIVMINDTHGVLTDEYKTGFSRFVGLLDELEQSTDVIKVANGDIFQGSYVSNINRGLPYIDIFNSIELDCFVIGNHEFDWGLDEISLYKDGIIENGEADFPFLGANIIDKTTGSRPSWIDEYVVVSTNNLNVGIIGLIGYGLESSILQDNVKNYQFIEPINVISKLSQELREERNCDIVIVSIHDYDDRLNQSIAKLSGKNKIDAILCGHTHELIDTVASYGSHTIPVIQNYGNNVTASNVILTVNDSNSVSYETNNYYINNYKNSDLVDKIIEKYQSYIDEGNRVVCKIDKSLTRPMLGKIATDTMKEYFNSDIAIINTGGVRSEIKSYNVTIQDIFKVFPFDNKIIIVDMSGSLIRSLYSRNSSFLYFNTDFDVNKIQTSKKYKIAVIDYVFTGPYYNEFRNLEYTNTEILLRNVVINYFEKLNKDD